MKTARTTKTTSSKVKNLIKKFDQQLAALLMEDIKSLKLKTA